MIAHSMEIIREREKKKYKDRKKEMSPRQDKTRQDNKNNYLHYDEPCINPQR